MWRFVLVIPNEGHEIKVFSTTALMVMHGPVIQKEAGV
jgi:hypothetical protein